MGGGLGWAAVGGGVRYRALACRASSGLLSLLLRSRPPPAREEEGEEDLVEGETARGEQHNHHKQPWSRYEGLRCPYFDLARWAVSTSQAGGRGFAALLGGGSKTGAF